jgi:hypothetical protein
MSTFNRELLPDMASTADTMAGEPEDGRVENEPKSRLQEILFSEVLTSVCYWSMVLLLAIVGAGLVYWRLTHPGPLAEPVSDPFGVTTPAWLIVSSPPLGVVAALGQAAWCAVRGQRVWKMLATAAGLIAVMGVTTLLETHLVAL